MKVEHIANIDEPSFFKRLSKFLNREDIEIVDVKYSTTGGSILIADSNDYYIEYAALVLYKDKKTITDSALRLNMDDISDLRKAYVALRTTHDELTDLLGAERGDTTAIYDAVKASLID